MSDASRSESAAPAAPRRSGFLVRWLKRLGILAVVLAVVGGGLLVVAEHETSQPEFCGSCHIMEDYYASWKADTHGANLDVACVDCHYAPGERTTVKAKLRGLSQVASYFSGRYGTSRPRAHVDDRSCLTSQCHGDLKFMEKELSLGTVKFTHANHLELHGEKLTKTKQELEAEANALRQIVGAERLGELETVAQEVGPAQARIDRMAALVQAWSVSVERERLPGCRNCTISRSASRNWPTSNAPTAIPMWSRRPARTWKTRPTTSRSRPPRALPATSITSRSTSGPPRA
jgi:hypothetical protein